MGANDSSDTSVPNNPYRDNNIGVEKLLEINSEENHDDVCLSYIFTYRDFADGVLGLAWVGEKGKRNLHGNHNYMSRHRDYFMENARL